MAYGYHEPSGPGNMNKRESSLLKTLRRLFRIAVIYAFLFVTPLQATGNTDYIIKAWMIEDGLPQNSVLALHYSQSGYLWFGTRLGLIRFNGLTFPVFNIWNTPGLKSNQIVSLYEDINGTLWIGSRGGGLTTLKNGLWKNYQIQDGLASNHIKAIMEHPSGTIWCGTTRGLNYFKNNKIFKTKIKGEMANASINALAADKTGNLWIGSEYGLLKKAYDQPPDQDKLTMVLNEPISDLASDKAGNLWVGTQKGVRFLKDGQIISPFSEHESLSDITVTCLYPDQKGALWIGTYGDGLYWIQNGHIRHYGSASGLSDDFIHSLIEDNEHNIWIGTFTGGLVRLKPRIVSNITREMGLPASPATCVLQDRKGFLWIGTLHHGLSQFKNERLVKTVSREDGLSSNRILSLCESNNSDIWIGTELGGLNRINDDRLYIYTTKQGLTSDSVSAILQDRSGILWIGTAEGLNAFINDNLITKEMFRGYHVKTLFEDDQGALWVGTQKGLSRIKHDLVRHFQASDRESGYEVLSIFESPDKPGVLWIGTNGTGLLRFEKDQFTQYTEKNGLHSNFVFSLTETGKGHDHYLWMSSFTGVFRVSFRSLNQFFNNETNFITSTFFNESDGMISSECVGGSFPSVWKSQDDKIFFPTTKGLAILDPQKISGKKSELPIVIEDFIIDNKSYIHKKALKIKSGKKMFEFYFTALNYSSPRNIIFRYRLEGFEDKWSTLGPNQKRTALYFNLSPGSYRFRVIACNHLGQWNEDGITLPFRIRSDFKEGLLVYIPRIIILLIFIGGFLLWRQKRTQPIKQTKKYQTSALTPERSQEIQQKLSEIMENEKIYLDPDLTLKKLSEKIMVHPNHISQIVNEIFKQSFNDYINNFRITEAKEKLLDPEEKKKTILEIAYDVGFYSKSVFNTAFKKFTGITPSQFKQKSKQ